MKINNFKIDKKSKTFIIAEIGINHGGRFKNCIKLIKAAKNAGADSVKLQITDPETSYEKKTKSYKEFSRARLNENELLKLKNFCDKNKIIFFVTPGDIKSLQIVSKLNLKVIKISSGLITNLPLIEEASKLNLPIILSTGMALKNEIKLAIKSAKLFNKKGVAVLKCTSVYPAKPKLLNLNAILEYKKYFNVPIGYSDHSLGLEACIIAVSIGAKIIEKHITLNKNLKGADHRLSLEPNEFKKMVDLIRQTESMLGSKDIKPTAEEIKLRKKYHRYLVANCDMKKGEKVNLEKIGIKRLFKYKNGALQPKYLKKIIGKKIAITVKKDDPITKETVRKR